MTPEQSDPQQQAELRGLKVSKRSSRKSSTRFLSVCFLLPAWKNVENPHAVLETGLRFARIATDNANHKNRQCPSDVQAAPEDAANAAVVNGHHKWCELLRGCYTSDLRQTHPHTESRLNWNALQPPQASDESDLRPLCQL